MSIRIDPATGLKVFNTRAASAVEDVIGKGYGVVEGDDLTTLPPEPPGAVFNAEEQARYQDYKEARRGAADYMAMEGEFSKYLGDVYSADPVPREALADEFYEDLHIRKGAQVQVMPWTVHRHRKLWDNPEAFMPERFLPQNRDRIDRFQYLPFGAGSRICIGASFAMQEAVIVLGVLLSRFRFDTVAETKPWPVQKLTTQPEGGLPMRVALRR